jgi:hypothetical protein
MMSWITYKRDGATIRLPAYSVSLPDDIQAAIQYIEAHKEEVMTAYWQILDRHCNVQYTPEVQAKLACNRQKLQAKLAEIRARHQGEGM